YRARAASSPIGRTDDVRVAPQLGVVRIAGVETADDRPHLLVQLDGRAWLDPRELQPRILASDQLTQPGPELAAHGDVYVGSQIPGSLTDTSHLHVGIEACGFLRQRSHDDQLRRCDGPAGWAVHHLRC